MLRVGDEVEILVDCGKYIKKGETGIVLDFHGWLGTEEFPWDVRMTNGIIGKFARHELRKVE